MNCLEVVPFNSVSLTSGNFFLNVEFVAFQHLIKVTTAIVNIDDNDNYINNRNGIAKIVVESYSKVIGRMTRCYGFYCIFFLLRI